MIKYSEVYKLVENYYKIKLYDSQKTAIKLMTKGFAVELQTGDGKSIAIIGTALYNKKNGTGKQYLVYHNEYIAKREFNKARNLLEKSILIDNKGDIHETANNIKESEYIFTSARDLMYVYIQLYMRGLCDEISLDSIIIDEIDLVAVDQITTDFSVSLPGNFTIPREQLVAIDAIITDWKGLRFNGILSSKEMLALEIENEVEYIISNDEEINLTLYGVNKLIEAGIFYESFFVNLVLSALRARDTIKLDINYIKVEDRIIMVDCYTGRPCPESRLDYSIQSFIEYYSNSRLEDKSVYTFGLSYVVLINEFSRVAGTSGTCKAVENVLGSLYKLGVKKVKPNFIKDYELQEIYAKDLKTVSSNVKEICNKHEYSPILVICTTDILATTLYELQEESERLILNLTAINIKDEEQIIDKLGRTNNIVFSTKIAGRGTDVITENKLVVIVVGTFRDERHALQAFGRTARNGSDGIIYDIKFFEDYSKFIPKKFINSKSSINFEKFWGMESSTKYSIYRNRLYVNYIKFHSIKRMFLYLKENNILNKNNIITIATFDTFITPDLEFVLASYPSNESLSKAIAFCVQEESSYYEKFI